MKLYLLNGTYYEKQADVPKGQGKFEAVEFPFAASPKADFVNWMNERRPLALAEAKSGMAVEDAMEPHPILADLTFKPIPERVEVTRDNPLQFDDAWETFPLARKLHFAALACEDAREAIR